MKPFFKPKVYLSARVSPEYRKANKLIADALSPYFEVFLPHEHNIEAIDPSSVPVKVFESNIGAMERADLCVIIPPFGRDCSWECGWFSGQRKPVYIITKGDLSWLRDLMFKSTIDGVFTFSSFTEALLKRDVVLSGRDTCAIRVFDTFERLGEELLIAYVNNNDHGLLVPKELIK